VAKTFDHFDQVRSIIEARLYAYGSFRLEYPDAPVSTFKLLGTPVQTSNMTSVQERWVTRYASELQNAAIIENVLRSLPDEEQRLIEMRYFEYARWGYICRKLSVSRATAYRIRDRALMAFAIEFGLLARAQATS